MHNDMMGIIKALELKHSEVDALREEVASQCKDQTSEKQLFRKFHTTDHLIGNSQEYQAFRTLLKACILYSEGRMDEAFAEGRRALEKFRICGNCFNEGLIHRFLALINLKQDKESLAISELSKAIQIFNSCAINYEEENPQGTKNKYLKKTGYEKQAEECAKLIQKIKTAGKGKIKNAFSKSNWPTASMVYGVFDIGHASRVGKFVLNDDEINQMSVEEINFDDKKHKIFNLRIGNQIRMNPAREYRWLRVAGTSMNNSTPIPIEPDDYVLVMFETDPRVGNIVFASLRHPPTPHERCGVIKRYSSEGLKSESHEPIDPIGLDEVDIRGVVLAVAKPMGDNASSADG
jgi:hypothetical protein